MTRREPIFASSGDPECDRYMKTIFNALTRHLVCISASIRRSDGREEDLICSGFVVQVGDEWMISTAGHFLKYLDENVRKGTSSIISASIADFFGPDAIVHHPTPFPLSTVHTAYIDDDALGLDFGFIFLSDLFQQGIQKNGVKPIYEENWAKGNDIKCLNYYVLGFPKQVADRVAESGRKGYAPVLISLEELPSVPDDVPTKPASKYRWFVGRLTASIDFHIGGMSGGPIVGVGRDKDGHLVYWIVAMQSGWHRPSRVIFGCPVQTFGEILLEALERVNPGRKFKRT
jgi:hypothetical protein